MTELFSELQNDPHSYGHSLDLLHTPPVLYLVESLYKVGKLMHNTSHRKCDLPVIRLALCPVGKGDNRAPSDLRSIRWLVGLKWWREGRGEGCPYRTVPVAEIRSGCSVMAAVPTMSPRN